MEKAYEPKKYEDEIYEKWERSGYCNPDALPGERTEHFSIVLPPPNVTGTLHLGHAIMLALQDTMVRRARMQGKKTEWLPGTDHAAIATQTKVEKLLMSRGIKNPRAELGREKFLQEVERFARDSHDTIVNQMKKMGASLDWSREAYTLDEPRNRAVNTMFKKMVNDGLVYRGNRIVNWCGRCQSTLADDEVEYKEEQTQLYYFKYGPVVIYTARPETKFLDKTIMVHPEDERYASIVGTEMDVEWIEGTVRASVIADSVVDAEFGTGAMTITPAHSKEDFDLAQKYNLPIVQIIDEHGNFTEAAGSFAGKNAAASRSAIVEVLAAKGLVERIDEHYIHNISICYRCGHGVEPILKTQWFLNVNKEFAFTQSPRRPIAGVQQGQMITLKQLMRHVVESGQIRMVPERFSKIYYYWVDNLRDWNISRQIWYGHRVPVWYKVDEMAVGEMPSGEGWTQDPDTLDTWFSSGMWTFSTLGWPEDTADVRAYHPTSVLETGYDIMSLWVSRMILMTTYALGEIPFEKLYLHGLVRDEQGRKMSKSLDNIIDPLDMIAEYGADALRMALVMGITPGNDTRVYPEKIASYRNFVNKLWNVARFITMKEETVGEPSVADRWIISRLHSVIAGVNVDYDNDQYGLAGEKLYHFLWGEFADWYVEMSKIKSLHSVKQREVLLVVLKLLHPMMPFVTEVIAREAKFIGEGELLMVAMWPNADTALIDEAIEQRFANIQELVTSIRNIRKEYRIEPGKRLEVLIEGASEEEAQIITHLARLTQVQQKAFSTSSTTVVGGMKAVLPLDGVIDVVQEKARIQNEISEAAKYVKNLEQKLSNAQYIEHAPAKVVEDTQARKHAAESRIQQLHESLQSLS